MKSEDLTVFGGLKALLICAALFYFGRWVSDSHDPIMIWIGVIFSCAAAFSAIKVFFSIYTASRKLGKQYEYSVYAHTPSGNFGNAKLADKNTPIVQKMAKNKSGIFLGAYENWLLFIDLFETGNAHAMTYAPARSGKTSCIGTPTAMNFIEGSFIAPSIKGDTVAIAQNTRKRKGQRVIIWNPFDILKLTGMKFNVLQILIDDAKLHQGKNLQKLSLLVAETLIPKCKNGENPFFRNGAVRLLAGYMIFLSTIRPWQCHLPGLNALVWSSEEERNEIVALMKANNKAGGLVRKYGNHLADLLKPEYIKTFGPMRDYAIDATIMFDMNTPFGQSLMGNDFSLKDILNGKTTFFPIIPEEELVTTGKTLGLIMALTFEEIAALKSPVNILMSLDEAGNFGHIPNLTTAMTLYPEKGLRVALFFQSRNQCVEIYGENETRNMEKNCTMISEWAISDPDDAKRWCQRCGNKTVKTYNMQHNAHDLHAPWKPSVSEKDHPVKSEYEIMTMPAHKQLLAIKGQPVIELDLVSYFEVEEWRKAADINPYHPGGYPSDKPVKYSLCG